MLFVELRFFVFFAVVLLVYWSLKKNDARKWFLLACSYYFYGSWDWRFAVMLGVLSAADYYFALRIVGTESRRARKMFVSASVAMNLSVLAFFKYFHFFVDSAIGMAAKFGAHLDEPTIHIILPVGVSFFTFQSLSYTIDVYRNEIPAVHSLRDYMMFASFFPQLVAGPIVRPKYFVPQMATARTVSLADVKAMMYLFLLGFIKKSCIADNISPYVDRVFSHPRDKRAGVDLGDVAVYDPDILRFFWLLGYGDRSGWIAGVQAGAELQCTLPFGFDPGFLAAVAYFAFYVDSGLHLHLAGRTE